MKEDVEDKRMKACQEDKYRCKECRDVFSSFTVTFPAALLPLIYENIEGEPVIKSLFLLANSWLELNISYFNA